MIIEFILIFFLFMHFVFIVIKTYDMIITCSLYNIKNGSNLSTRFHRIHAEKGIEKANRFLSLSHYNPLNLYKQLLSGFKNKFIKFFFTIYYKWPTLLFISSAWLFIVSKYSMGYLYELILIVSIILMIISEVIHEVSARLMLGSIDNMRHYIFIDIENSGNREKYTWNLTKLLRDFFLTLSIQLFSFCFAYAAMIYAVSKYEIGQISGKALSIMDSIYFSVTTLTTTGYGDLTPTGQLSKILIISEMMVIYMFVILIAAHFALSLTETLSKKS